MFNMPWAFLWIGFVIMLPEMLHWSFVTRRKNKAWKKIQEQWRLQRSIKELEAEMGIDGTNRTNCT